MLIESRCNNDTASILLVNNQTLDQYECSLVPTAPDNIPEMSTCPIQKNQMSTGNWAILLLGNNVSGKPFAWQRSFNISVGPQQTITITPTATGTSTSYPTTTINCRYFPSIGMMAANRGQLCRPRYTSLQSRTGRPSRRAQKPSSIQ